MAYPYRVVLSEAQRAELRGLVGSGTAPARTLTRARILLKADHGDGGPGWSDAAIAGALDVNPSTVLRVRRQFVAEGLAAALQRRRPDRVYERRLDGAQEAHLVALACSAPPDGQARWAPAGRRAGAPAGRRAGAPGGGGGRLPRDGAPDAQKTRSSRT